MKISGDKLIEVYHTWLKDYFSNVRLTSSKVNWLKLPLAKNRQRQISMTKIEVQ